LQVKREGKKILVVDDDNAILKSLKLVLEAEGYVVATAETGGEAIVKSKNNYYDLALLDIRLPDMQGTELLTRMNLGVPRMRVIMITGYPSLENTIGSLNRGADGYLVKPIDPPKLLKIIEEKLKEQEAEIQEYERKEAMLGAKTMPEYCEPV